MLAKKNIFLFNMIMNVSFTGVNNLIFMNGARKLPDELYRDNDGNIRRETVSEKNIFMSADLDDAGYKDLSEFQNALKKSRPCYQLNCINKDTPNRLDLHCTTFSAPQLKQSVFRLNKYELMLDEKQILPLMEYLENLLKRIQSSTKYGMTADVYAKEIGTAVKSEIVRCINRLT